MSENSSNLEVVLAPEKKFDYQSEEIESFLEASHGESGHVISAPVATIIERVLCDAESSCPCENIGDVLTPYYVADLMQDLKDLNRDTCETGKTFDHIYSDKSASYYPRLEMTKSCVSVFPNRKISEKVASFISNTSISYKGTKRSDISSKSSTLSFRVSVISSEDPHASAPEVQPIDFSNEFEYWSFVGAISKACDKDTDRDFRWSGRGMIHQPDSDIKKEVFKFLSGDSGNSHMVKIGDERLEVMAGTKCTLSLPLININALALSCDWPSPKAFVLEVDIQGDGHINSGASLALIDGNLEVLESHQYYQKTITDTSEDVIEANKVLLPVDYVDLQNELTSDGLSSIAIINNEADGNNHVHNVLAIDTIPFVTFKSYSQQRLETGESPKFKPVLYQATVNSVKVTTNPAHKAAEVHIIGATDLCELGGSEPSCYCAVYLVDRNGEKINARGNGVSRIFSNNEEGDWKTDTIPFKSNPTWDTKLQLQEDGDVGIDAVASVRIVVKEAGTFRFRKPRHLGQVNIPIGCFIENTPVPLMLPLEPSARMDGDPNAQLGVLHVMTQAVTVKNGSMNKTDLMVASVVKPVNRARAGSTTHADPVDTLPLQYTLKAASADALNVYWPFKVLGGGLAGTEGHVLWGKEGLIVDISPGAGGILANCIERKQESEERLQLGLKPVSYFSVKWSNIGEAYPLSSSVLKIEVMVNKAVGTEDKRKSSQFLKAKTPYHPGSPQRVCVELLVAPCPSKMLQCGVVERKALLSARSDLQERLESMDNFRANPRSQQADAQKMLSQARNLLIKLDGDMDPGQSAKVKKNLSPDRVTIVESVSGSAGASRWTKRQQIDRNGNKRKSETIVSGGGAAAVASELKSITISSSFSKYDKMVVKARCRIRRELYRAQLLHICRGLARPHGRLRSLSRMPISNSNSTLTTSSDEGSPDDPFQVPCYSVSVVDALLKFDIDSILARASYFSSNLSTELFELHSMIIQTAQKRILDYVLCSTDAPDPTIASDCIKKLVLGFFKFLRESFETYLGDPISYKRTPGQEAKIMLLQMVVFCDDILDSLIRRGLWVMRWEINPKLTLLNQNYQRQDVIDWYAASLQLETAQWLSKTIMQASTFKENDHVTPWDFEKVGDFVLSHLPETVVRQNKDFLEICDHTATKFAYTTAATFGEDYVAEIERLRDRISFEMVEASNRCLFLLAEEYQNVLKIKDWCRIAQSSTTRSTKGINDSAKLFNAGYESEEELNFFFLLSMANDCWRVIDITQESIASTSSASNRSSGQKVINKFKQTARLILMEVFRVIYADVHNILIDFKSLWESDKNEITKKLVYNAETYLEHCGKALMNPDYLHTLVGFCANVIAGSLLMMVKERALDSKKFSAAELYRLKNEISDASYRFSQFLTEPAKGSATAPSELKSFVLLNDLLGIIMTPFLSKENNAVDNEPLSKTIVAVTYSYPLDVADGLLKDGIYMREDIPHEILDVLKNALDVQRNSPKHRDSLVEDSRVDEAELIHMCEQIYDKAIIKDAKSGKDFFKGLRLGLSNAFSKNQTEAEKKAKEMKSRFLKMLNLGDIDLESRISSALRISEDSRSLGDISEKCEVAMVKMEIQDDEADFITLSISRIEIRGVISDAYFCTANPYLAFTVDHQRVKTPVLWNIRGGSASWGKTNLTVKHRRSELVRGRMEIELFDKERIHRKRFKGKVVVNLGGLDLHRIESWFALKGSEHEGAEVFVCIDIVERESMVLSSIC